MLSSKSRHSLPVLTIILVFFITLAVQFHPTYKYPYAEVENSHKVKSTYLLSSNKSSVSCEQTLNNLVNTVKKHCPDCNVVSQNCLGQLTPQQQSSLSATQLPYPSSRFNSGSNNGLISHISSDSKAATDACFEHEHQFSKTEIASQCHPQNSLLPKSNYTQENKTNQLLTLLLTLLAAVVASYFVTYLIIRYEHMHSHFSHDHIESGPQKFHTTPTARIGGIGIISGLLVANWLQPLINNHSLEVETYFDYILLAAMPAFLGGIVEDITKNVGVLQRLILTMISGAIGAWLMGAIIYRADIAIFDAALSWLPFAIIFTAFAIGGVANAINIIDGYNGLSGGISIIMLTAIAFVAAQVGDQLVLIVSVSMAGAILGFLIWNWPGGNIFMGDGGAYLVGFTLAELSVLLLCRNPSVSPWFPLILLGHPVFETLFSVYRRKFLHQTVPGHPDALHLHQLLFKWIVRNKIRNGRTFMTTSNNSKVAPYAWLAVSLAAVFAVLFWRNTTILMLGFLVGSGLYVLLYWKLSTLNLERQKT